MSWALGAKSAVYNCLVDDVDYVDITGYIFFIVLYRIVLIKRIHISS